jgi:hypothetical protein
MTRKGGPEGYGMSSRRTLTSQAPSFLLVFYLIADGKSGLDTEWKNETHQSGDPALYIVALSCDDRL